MNGMARKIVSIQPKIDAIKKSKFSFKSFSSKLNIELVRSLTLKGIDQLPHVFHIMDIARVYLFKFDSLPSFYKYRYISKFKCLNLI